MKEYLEQSTWKINENANTNYSLSGLHMHIFEKETKKYMLETHYKGKIAKAYRDGYIHIHDLGYLSNYCCGHNLQTLLTEGLNGVEGQVSSVPPKHLRSAVNQMVNYLFVMQSENAGAQAFSNVDTLLAPLVKKDNLDYSEVKQCMQEFVFSINFPTRSGLQSPFTNVTFDLKCPDMYKEQEAIIGGEKSGIKYGECNREIGMISKAFFELMMDGDADGKPFTFPIPTVNLHENFVWDDDIAKTIFEATAKYGTANFQNFFNSDMDPQDSYSMCCRLRLDKRELIRNTGGVFGSSPNTGSIGVVTINLPRLAYEADGDVEKFFSSLDNFMHLSKESLEIKRSVITQHMDAGLYPYMKRYIGSFDNFFSTIGYIGMNEALISLIGEQITTQKGMDMAEKILKYMRDGVADIQEATDHYYNLEQSPAEGAAYKLARRDRKDYPDIPTQGEEAPYYTNSSHMPVDSNMSMFPMLQSQERFNQYINGGTACHVYLGQRVSDWINCMTLVKKIATNTTLPFFDLTPTFSICPVHGYISGEHKVCPLEHTQEQIEKFGVDSYGG